MHVPPKPVISRPCQYLESGTRRDADADVAKRRRIVQEMAPIINQWHEQQEQRKASYPSLLLADSAMSLMLHGMMPIVCIL